MDEGECLSMNGWFDPAVTPLQYSPNVVEMSRTQGIV
jgi:hypothetical protein